MIKKFLTALLLCVLLGQKVQASGLEGYAQISGTCTITGTAVGGGITYTVGTQDFCYYDRIGSLVRVVFSVNGSTSGTAGSTIVVTGLPFPVGASSSIIPVTRCADNGATTFCDPRVTVSASTVTFFLTTFANWSNTGTNTRVQANFTYSVN